MPNTKSAAKRLRSDAKRRLRNRMHKSRIKSYEHRFLEKLAANDVEGASRTLSECFSCLDRAATSGAIHANRASRKKARLTARLQKLTA